MCAEGYFSNSSSALDSCIKHQECATGQIALFSGSISHDTMCATCEDLASGGRFFAQFIIDSKILINSLCNPGSSQKSLDFKLSWCFLRGDLQEIPLNVLQYAQNARVKNEEIYRQVSLQFMK